MDLLVAMELVSSSSLHLSPPLLLLPLSFVSSDGSSKRMADRGLFTFNLPHLSSSGVCTLSHLLIVLQVRLHC